MTFTELSCELPDHAGWRQTASMLWPSGWKTNAPYANARNGAENEPAFAGEVRVAVDAFSAAAMNG
jgi:hypothetical protein